jgi:hypothetical protein
MLVCKFLILLLNITAFLGISILNIEEESMRRFNFYLPIDLFNRIKLMANYYGISITKLMVELLELGYLQMLGNGGMKNETNNK